MNRFLSKVEFFYYAILPYFGYVSVFILKGRGFGTKTLPFAGWIVLLVYQVVFLAVLKESESKGKNFIFSMLPPVLIGINRWLFGNGLWNFFLEQTILEVIAFMIAISLIFLFSKESGDYLWKDLGIIPFIVVGFIFLGSLGYIETWIGQQSDFSGWNYYNLLLFATAMIIRVVYHYGILVKIVKRELVIKEVFPDTGFSIFLIVGQVAVWMFIIPLIFNLTGN